MAFLTVEPDVLTSCSFIDNTTLATTSAEGVQLWSVATGALIESGG
jgi:hypothetical protein